MIVSPPIGQRKMHFYSAYPSCTGVAVVFVHPVSSTIADDRPHAKDDSTASLHKNNAGTLYFSNRNSVSFSRRSLLWIEFSVKMSGVSLVVSIRLVTSDVLRMSSKISKSTAKDQNKSEKTYACRLAETMA